MAYSIHKEVGTGQPQVYDVLFPYLEIEHVYVYAIDSDFNTELDYEWVSDTQIEVLNAPNGEEFWVQRKTPRDNLQVDWEDGAVLHERNLQDAHHQHLYITQEMDDGFLWGYENPSELPNLLLERSIKVPDEEPEMGAVLTPDVANRAEKVFTWDISGNISARFLQDMIGELPDAGLLSFNGRTDVHVIPQKIDYSQWFADIDHDHDLQYAAIDHDHDGVYAPIDHDHDELYAPLLHTLGSHSDVSVPIPADNDILTWDSGLSQWVAARSTSALGFVRFDYRMKLPPNVSPATGRLSRNTSDPATTTLLYFNKLENSGHDISIFFEYMKEGDWLNVYEQTDSTNWEAYDVLEAPNLIGDVWVVSVTPFNSGGDALLNNDKVDVVMRVSNSGSDAISMIYGNVAGDIIAQGHHGYLFDTSGPSSLVLPSAAPDNTLVFISDRTGQSELNPIVISTADGSSIMGFPTFNIREQYQGVELVKVGAQWNFVSTLGEQIVAEPTQVSSGVPEAPIDGEYYARGNTDWKNINELASGGIHYQTLVGSVVAQPNQGYLCDTTIQPITIILPIADDNFRVQVADSVGNAAVNTVTMVPQTGETIMGTTSFVLNQAYQAVGLVKLGTDWKFISTVGESVTSAAVNNALAAYTQELQAQLTPQGISINTAALLAAFHTIL